MPKLLFRKKINMKVQTFSSSQVGKVTIAAVRKGEKKPFKRYKNVNAQRVLNSNFNYLKTTNETKLIVITFSLILNILCDVIYSICLMCKHGSKNERQLFDFYVPHFLTKI